VEEQEVGKHQYRYPGGNDETIRGDGKGEMRWSRVLKIEEQDQEEVERSLRCRKPCSCATHRENVLAFPDADCISSLGLQHHCGCSGAIFDGLRLHLFNNQLYIHIDIIYKLVFM